MTEVIRPTTLLAFPRLNERLGLDLTLASETFQLTGSFKFRAAYNVASSVPHRRIITASSGNFGQALAYACHLLGKESHIVMPDNSAGVKIAAVREFGGTVHLVDTARITRAERVAELARQFPDAYLASAYDDPLVIEGNASLGKELGQIDPGFDAVLAPIGGGGLTAGLVLGLKQRPTCIYAVEPALANDASRSWRAGAIVRNTSEPQTIADGARTLSLGQHNWAQLRAGLTDVLEVSEEQIGQALRLLFGLANLKAEPTGAVAVAGLLAHPELFRGQRVCCVVSGGNVDPSVYARLVDVAVG